MEKDIVCPVCGSASQIRVYDIGFQYSSEITKEYICGCGCAFAVVFEAVKVKVIDE